VKALDGGARAEPGRALRRWRENVNMSRTRDLLVSVCWYATTGGVAAVLVPWWLTRWHADHAQAWWPAAAVLGGILLSVGLVATGWVFVEFVRAGGTPMPGAMTQRLVVTGLNRHVRNPIYLGAFAVLVGEALLLLRWSLFVFSFAAWAATAGFVRWYEQPLLARRFGTDYDAYCLAVRAWLPRLAAWTPDPPSCRRSGGAPEYRRCWE
jgi:protein-S-isoprenylcysteine O-methyltransferase Ste14